MIVFHIDIQNYSILAWVQNTNKFDPFQLNDKVAEFEQEKFEMQKQHTQNIQELLDETNQRLQKMETEYNQQNSTTVSTNTCIANCLWNHSTCIAP